jgi:hypothetical protein
VLEIFKKSLGFNPLPVIIQKDRQCTSRCNIEFTGRRHKSRCEAHEVTDEDKKADGSYQWQVFFSIFTDKIGQQIFKKLNDELHNILEFGWDKLRFSRREGKEEDQEHSGNQAHNNVIRDEVFRVCYFDSHQRKKKRERFTQ